MGAASVHHDEKAPHFTTVQGGRLMSGLPGFRSVCEFMTYEALQLKVERTLSEKLAPRRPGGSKCLMS